MNKILWAPWRMDYVTNPKKEKDIFLKKGQSKNCLLYTSDAADE